SVRVVDVRLGWRCRGPAGSFADPRRSTARDAPALRGRRGRRPCGEPVRPAPSGRRPRRRGGPPAPPPPRPPHPPPSPPPAAPPRLRGRTVEGVRPGVVVLGLPPRPQPQHFTLGTLLRFADLTFVLVRPPLSQLSELELGAFAGRAPLDLFVRGPPLALLP